jgi:signal transduction histidine kinase
LISGEGKTIGALTIFQDITQVKALEEKLRQADRLAALGTLSAGLAHEIKNPLSAIKTFVQLIPQKIGNRAFMEKFNITVPREIDRINHLVEDLLELTRNRVRPLVNLKLDALIHQVIDLHGEELKRRQVALEVRLEEGIPPMRGDTETLSRAFSNLIINATQAMPNGGTLSISSRFDSSSSSVEITFEDTGIGMDEITARNVFNPFFTTKDKGVGLGLALTRKIIEDHQGRIRVASQMGKGTAFILVLPVVKS